MLERWTIERVLSTDGMAEVLLARERAGQAVVIKRMLPHLASNEELVATFRHEASLAVGLRHPNIVEVREVGEHEGSPFIVMEWLDGLDLRAVSRALLTRRTRMHPAQALAIGADVARGLAYAHAIVDATGQPLGLVHRDVSPRNVVVTRHGDVKLLDFGIAKTRGIATRSGLAVGTPAYMAPEQVDGLRVDARTDLFALGIVLWEMLTGRRLWDLPDHAATVRAVKEAPAPPPSLFTKGLDPSVDVLVLGLLAKFPAGRPRSAETASLDLARLATQHGSKDPRYELAQLIVRAEH